MPAYLLTFVNVLGFSVLMPILPFVVEKYGAPEWVYGLLLTMYSAFQFIGAPFLGGLSDAMGRKRILLISQAGTLLSWLIFALALSLPNIPIYGCALPLLVIGFSRMFDGITGGNVSVTNAYISDITTRKEKSVIFGYLGGIAGLGMIVGPGIGGLAAATSLGFFGTILVAIGISIVTLITIIFWLKESHPVEKRGVRERQNFWQMINVPAKIKNVNPSELIKSIFLVKLFFSSMMGFYIGSMALFLIDLFKFSESQLGTFLFVVGAFLAFNQAVVSKFFIRKFGEFKTLLIGLALCSFGLIALTFTSNLFIFIGFYYVLNLGLSLCFPTFNALISIHANPQKQGAVMGISESINSLAMSIFPLVSAALYGLFGFQLFFFVSLLPVVAFILAFKSFKRVKISASEELS